MKKLKNKDLQRITIAEFKKAEKTPVTIVLDNVRSALNVGSIFRTADAFLIEEIILCGITAIPPSKEIRKAALGATDSMNWSYNKSTIDAINKLKKEGHYIIAVEQTKKSSKLNKFTVNNKPIVIILGNEVNGVDQEIINICDEVIEIPQFGTKHSLNIAVAAGIVTWEIYKKIKS